MYPPFNDDSYGQLEEPVVGGYQSTKGTSSTRMVMMAAKVNLHYAMVG